LDYLIIKKGQEPNNKNERGFKMKKIETRKVEGHETEGIFGKDYVAGGWAVFDGEERISHIHADKEYVDDLAQKVRDRGKSQLTRNGLLLN
jgi:hypothetical protein